jgi:hypothetical protein
VIGRNQRSGFSDNGTGRRMLVIPLQASPSQTRNTSQKSFAMAIEKLRVRGDAGRYSSQISFD